VFKKRRRENDNNNSNKIYMYLKALWLNLLKLAMVIKPPHAGPSE
jgi:hypothetical protein